MLKKLFLYLILLLGIITNAQAQVFNKKNNFITLNVVPEFNTLSKTNKTLTVITAVSIKPGWHVYWHNPGDTGDPTILTFYDSPYYSITQSTRTAPQKFVFEDIITTYVHRQNLYFKTEFKLNNLSAQAELSLKQILTYTVCKKECLPGKIAIDIKLPITDTPQKNPDFIRYLLEAENTFSTPLNTLSKLENETLELQVADTILKECPKPEFISWHPKKNIISNLPTTEISEQGHVKVSFDKGETPPDAKGVLLCPQTSYDITPAQNDPIPTPKEIPNQPNTLAYYLITAFLAGLILNLMPCVLPILSLKALYLAAHKEKASPLSALIYLLGVLSSFMVLSGLLFYLRQLGQELGWGFQLQSPAFNIFLMLLFFIIFLSLIDKLQIPDIFADKLNKLSHNKSFLTGFFAVIIACPCTGPFMGAALGYAVMQPPLIYFGIFLSLGLGYALPYVLIESFPAFFLKFIPKPGHWMITLKRILSIPIALTCLWLFWITANQLCPKPQTDDILWEEYTPQKVEQSLKANQPVFIDFTAKWCLICLLNDKTTLNSQSFKQLAKEKHLKLYKADWTNHSKEIADALQSYGRNSIPLYIYYKPQSREPIYLPQILTTNILNNVLQ